MFDIDKYARLLFADISNGASKPSEKDIMIKVILNLLNEK
jgi:hypothetical protein